MFKELPEVDFEPVQDIYAAGGSGPQPPKPPSPPPSAPTREPRSTPSKKR